MPTTITRQQFLSSFSNSRIDVNAISEDDWSQLTQAGIERNQLESLADDSGIISGSNSIAKLWTLLDSFDRNGSSYSFLSTTTSPTTGLQEPTTSGLLHTTLKEHREYDVEVTSGMFQEDFEHTQLVLEKFTPAEWQAFENAGIQRTEIERLAGSDGIIRGDRDIAKLFSIIDRGDNNGSSHSFTAGSVIEHSAIDRLNARGLLLQALKRQRCESQVVSREAFVDSFQGGSIRLDEIPAELMSQLSELGLTQDLLSGIAGNDGMISGRSACTSLFYSVDKLDQNGSSRSFDASTTIAYGSEPSADELTDAGKAYQLLKQCFSPFEQSFTRYSDASKALKSDLETHPAIALDVPHMTQPAGSTLCWDYSMRMLKAYDAELYRTQANAFKAHYVARGEDRYGAICGHKRDFEDARSYIDHCLTLKRPVVVGVSHKDDKYNLDRMTDHFMIVTGRGIDEEGRLYYEFNDPGTGGEFKINRLYVDQETGLLFSPNDRMRSSYGSKRCYQLSQVRCYTDIPFEEVTSHNATSYR